MMALVKEKMEQKPIILDVPLVIDIGVSKN